MAAEREPTEAAAELSLTTRVMLLERLRDPGDDDAWMEFAAIYRQFIRRLALKANLREHDAEEVVQEVLLSVFRNIKGFRYQPETCSFRSWLTKMIRWRIADQWKRQIRGTPGGESAARADSSRTDLLLNIPDTKGVLPDEALDVAWGSQLVEKALERVKNGISDKQYQMYFLRVLRHRPMAEVCARLGVNRAQVYLAKMRVGRVVEREIRRLSSTALV